MRTGLAGSADGSSKTKGIKGKEEENGENNKHTRTEGTRTIVGKLCMYFFFVYLTPSVVRSRVLYLHSTGAVQTYQFVH